MSSQISILVPQESTPLVQSVWELSRLFRVNWATPFTVENRWSTSITVLKNGGEKRVSQLGNPFRSFGFKITCTSYTNNLLLLNGLSRLSMSRSLLPLYCDASRLTANASAGATTIYLDTTYRRFIVGARIALGSMKDGSNFTIYEYATIQSFTTTTITLVAGLANSYSQRDIVFPIAEVEPINMTTLNKISGQVVSGDIKLTEAYDAQSLPPNSGYGGFSPTMYLGYPIFWPLYSNLNMPSTGWMGFLKTTQCGQTPIIDSIGTRIKKLNNYDITHLTREGAWEMLSFFDTCRGSLLPFWSVHHLPLFQPTSYFSNGFLMNAVGPHADWNQYTHIAFRVRGVDVPVIKQILSVTRISGVDIVTLPDLAGVDTTKIMYVTAAYLSRFNTDTLNENWTTTRVCKMSFSTVELINEYQAPIGGLS